MSVGGISDHEILALRLTSNILTIWILFLSTQIIRIKTFCHLTLRDTEPHFHCGDQSYYTQIGLKIYNNQAIKLEDTLMVCL